MRARLLYFNTRDFFKDMENEYRIYKAEGIQNKVNMFFIMLLLALDFIIGFVVRWDYGSPLYIGVIVFVVMFCIVLLSLLLNCICTGEFYSKYKTLEAFISEGYDLNYIRLLNNNKAIVSSELQRIGKHYILKYSYVEGNRVLEKRCTDIDFELKCRSDIDGIWLCVEQGILYVPYHLKNRVLTASTIALDTVFTKNKILMGV